MKKHACPSCGGTLGIPERHERVFTCSFCGSVIEDAAAATPRPDGRVEPALTVSTRWVDASSIPSYSGPKSYRLVLALVVVVFGIAGAVVFAVLANFDEVTDSIAGPDFDGLGGNSIASGTVLAGSADGNGGVIAVVRDDPDFVVHHVDLDDDEPPWHDTLGAESTPFDIYVANDETVYLVSKDKAFAWDRASGQRRFSVTLSDEILPQVCHDCVQLIGGSLVVLTSDGTLAGLDPGTGETKWSQTMTEVPRQLLNFGGSAAVLDGGTPSGAAGLEVYEVDRGALTATVPLSCPGTDRSGAGVYDHLQPLPDGGFFWEGTDIISSCAQRFAPGATTPLWSSPLADGGVAVDNAPEIFTVAGTRALSVHDGTVWWYDLETGARTATVRDDERLTILGTGDGRLYLAAESTRGSSSWTVLALDPDSGEVVWTFDPGTDLIDGANPIGMTQTGWTAAVVDGGIVVMNFDDEAESIRFQVLSAADGTSSDAVTVDLAPHAFIVWPSLLGVRDGGVVIGVGTTILEIDPLTGEIVARAP